MAPWIFSRAILKGDPIQLFNEGDMQRSFTFIDDATLVMERLLDSPPEGNNSPAAAPWRVLNVGTDRTVPLLRFVEILEDALGVPAARELLPMQPGDVPSTHADRTQLLELIGDYPQTSIEDGVRAFAAWFRAYHEGEDPR